MTVSVSGPWGWAMLSVVIAEQGARRNRIGWLAVAGCTALLAGCAREAGPKSQDQAAGKADTPIASATAQAKPAIAWKPS